MATDNLFTQIKRNKRKTIFIFLLFLGLFSAMGLLVGYIWGSPIGGLVVSLLVAGLYALIMFASASSMILKMSNAQKVTKESHPMLWNVTEGVAMAAGIPMPQLYIIQDDALNAFATGTKPEDGVVAVTTGLLAKLDRRELEGVVAHEVAHIRNYDIRVMLYAAVLVGAITLLSDMLLRSFLWGGGGDSRGDGRARLIAIVVGLVLAILAPIIAELIRLAVSRRREFLADADAVLITRNPDGIANALKKISGDRDPLLKTANKATAHMYFSSPFTKKQGSTWQKWFSTHPPMEERLEALRRLGARG